MEWYKAESHQPATEATILQSKNRREIILIPRIKLAPILSFVLERNQLPL